MDAGRMLADAGGGDAAAQPPAGGTLTADTDSRQLVTELVPVPPDTTLALAAGPLVVTDAVCSSASNTSVRVFVGATPDCPAAGSRLIARLHAGGPYIGGARYLVPAGSTLCAANTSVSDLELAVAGFRPYE
jgi:hypothetical protein